MWQVQFLLFIKTTWSTNPNTGNVFNCTHSSHPWPDNPQQMTVSDGLPSYTWNSGRATENCPRGFISYTEICFSVLSARVDSRREQRKLSLTSHHRWKGAETQSGHAPARNVVSQSKAGPHFPLQCAHRDDPSPSGFHSGSIHSSRTVHFNLPTLSQCKHGLPNCIALDHLWDGTMGVEGVMWHVTAVHT